MLLLSLLMACPGPEPKDTSPDTDTTGETGDDTGTPVPVQDEDGDGYTPTDGDCDDEDADVRPGRLEDCNGIDDNCDGTVDEGQADTDGDGTPDCSDVEDCDGADNDGDGSVDEDSPDVDLDGTADCVDVEDCDGVDNDGDGEADEGFDGDGDGFPSCDDCDDGAASVYPGANDPEDGLDNDCDGLADDGLWGPGDLAIVEVMANPQDVRDPDGEWVEILNTSTRSFSLDGIVLRTTSGSVAIEGSPVLAPGERVVVGSADQVWIDVVYAGLTLANESDTLAVLADGTELDSLAWDNGATMPDVAGASISLDPWYLDAVANDLADRWCASTLAFDGPVGDYGSPGMDNEPCVTIDHDYDGLPVDAGDCDDTDPAVAPGLPDAWYDGVDTDCDGWSDFDADLDGFDSGDFGGGDCDDADATVSPAADEACDASNTDEDCDGLADDDDTDADGKSTFYADGDGDGYGDPDASAEYCDAPADYLADDTDCDDSSDAVSPGAAEVCGNGVDDNCDDAANGCGPSGDQSIADADGVVLGVDASDNAGRALTGIGDIDGDGMDDLLVGAWGGDAGGTNSGEAYVLYGPVTDYTALSEATETLLGEDPSDYAGYAVQGIGDATGDGTPDFLVGAYGDDVGGSEAGAVYLVSGGLSGSLDLADATAKITGEDASDDLGQALASVGDVTGDGIADYVAGAINDDDGGSNAGAAYLVAGDTVGDVDAGLAEGKIYGEDRDDAAGVALAGGSDLDGDGIEDLLVAARGDDTSGFECGAVYLLYMPVSGSLDLASADAKVYGVRASDGLYRAAMVGDVDGDGGEDFAVGATSARGSAGQTGVAYVFTSLPAGSVAASTADTTLEGVTASDSAGAGLAGAGDLDADGTDDLLVGASALDDGADRDVGALYLLFGSLATGTSALDDVADATYTGEDGSDALGTYLTAAGDLDGDGFADFAAGIPASDDAGTDAGAVHVILGGEGW
ncbi:MAG: MopE-related protein [Myxococcota bacterium]